MPEQEESRARQMPTACHGSPVLVIVIPAYGHPALLIEALESALKQRTAIEYRIVLVNDGCPLAQTHRTCSTYAAAYPNCLVYLRKKNGGLSSARNHGVQTGLALWPTVRGFFFLDADNRLHPSFVEQACTVLDEHPDAGWFFPDMVHFGAARALIDLSAPFSRLELLLQNYCEAGSLVRREVFEAGLRFDENMRHGYEDWEFWLHAMKHGFAGQHSPRLRFWYRKRSESMLANTDREATAITTYIRRKHPDIYNLRYATATAAQEGPRWAFWLPDQDRILLASTAAEADESVSWAEFARRLRRWRAFRQWQACPPVLVVVHQSTLELLRQHALLAHILWTMEADLEQHHLTILTIEQMLGLELRVQFSAARLSTLQDRQRAVMCMISSRLLDECLCTSLPDFLTSMSTEQPQPRVVTRHLVIDSPSWPSPVPSDVLAPLCQRVEVFGIQHRTVPAIRMNLGRQFYRRPHEANYVIRDLFGCPCPPGITTANGQRHIGFVLPLCEFGGVERITANLARECKRLGFAVHLFVVGSEQARLLTEFTSTFDSMHLVPDTALTAPSSLLSLLGGMDVVINNHSAPLHHILGDLRRQGTKLITQLQVVDFSMHGVPCGYPYVTLEYEHALHRITAPSQHLVNWLQAWGIPEDKIILMPNGPGFEVPQARVTAALLARGQRTQDTPLRVLFMARFDRQKGLDRLIALVRLANAHSARLDWRIVGKPVLVEYGAQPIDLDALRPWLWPPALDAQSLIAHYTWADVLVLPSRFEGSPLGILEAQSLGCVPLATACGAVDEQIEEGVTGYLFDNTASTEAFSVAMLDRLMALQGDRGLLLHMAEQATKTRREQSWQYTTGALATCLHAWFPAQEAR